MYKIGSYVIYRAEGVCKISDIRAESFGAIGAKEQYYILTPMGDPHSTLFVPTENEKLVSLMRPLLSAEEICALCAELRESRMEWIDDSRARNMKYRDIMSLGDRKDLIVVANTVSERIEAMIEVGKKPNATDENALKRVVKMLYDEFKSTTDIASENDVIPLLRGELQINEK